MSSNFNLMKLSPCDEVQDRLDALFTGYGSTASVDEFLRASAKCFWQDVENILRARQSFALSGAMRWPWSQEAPISYDRRLRGL